MFRYKSKYKKVGVLPIRIVKSNASSVGPSSERNACLFLSLVETLEILEKHLFLTCRHFVREKH